MAGLKALSYLRIWWSQSHYALWQAREADMIITKWADVWCRMQAIGWDGVEVRSNWTSKLALQLNPGILMLWVVHLEFFTFGGWLNMFPILNPNPSGVSQLSWPFMEQNTCAYQLAVMVYWRYRLFLARYVSAPIWWTDSGRRFSFGWFHLFTQSLTYWGLGVWCLPWLAASLQPIILCWYWQYYAADGALISESSRISYADYCALSMQATCSLWDFSLSVCGFCNCLWIIFTKSRQNYNTSLKLGQIVV